MNDVKIEVRFSGLRTSLILVDVPAYSSAADAELQGVLNECQRHFPFFFPCFIVRKLKFREIRFDLLRSAHSIGRLALNREFGFSH